MENERQLKQSRSSMTAGFTLIELLVVMAIVAVLASMLLPSLSKARNSAKFLACMVKMRDLGLAVQLYAPDYDKWLPPAGYPHLYDDSQIVCLLPYDIIPRQGRYFCPSDEVPYVVDATHTYLGPNNVKRYTGPYSYAYNGYMGNPFVTPQMHTLDSLGSPARMALFTELNLGGWTFFTTSTRWYDEGWPAHPGYNAYGRHDNLTQNILLADGHVQKVRYKSPEYFEIECDPAVLGGR